MSAKTPPPLHMHLLRTPQLAGDPIFLSSACCSGGSWSREQLALKTELWIPWCTETNHVRRRKNEGVVGLPVRQEEKAFVEARKRTWDPEEDVSTVTRSTGFATIFKHRWVKIGKHFLRLLSNGTCWGQTELEWFSYLLLLKIFCKTYKVLTMVDISWVYVCVCVCAHIIILYVCIHTHIYIHTYAIVYIFKRATLFNTGRGRRF